MPRPRGHRHRRRRAREGLRARPLARASEHLHRRGSGPRKPQERRVRPHGAPPARRREGTHRAVRARAGRGRDPGPPRQSSRREGRTESRSGRARVLAFQKVTEARLGQDGSFAPIVKWASKRDGAVARIAGLQPPPKRFCQVLVQFCQRSRPVHTCRSEAMRRGSVSPPSTACAPAAKPPASRGCPTGTSVSAETTSMPGGLPASSALPDIAL